jgi:hypothetical protein
MCLHMANVALRLSIQARGIYLVRTERHHSSGSAVGSEARMQLTPGGLHVRGWLS